MAWHKLAVTIEGVSAYVPSKFGGRTVEKMLAYFSGGSRKHSPAAKGELPDPEEEAQSRLYVTPEGKYGIPAVALRKAVIEAGRFCNMVMRRLYGAIDVEPQGIDRDNGLPLVLLEGSEPRTFVSAVKNTSGTRDLRYRPYFEPGWRATFTLCYDSDTVSEGDLKELLEKAGMNVGIGDGRPLSPNSPGLGFGRFKTVSLKPVK